MPRISLVVVLICPLVACDLVERVRGESASAEPTTAEADAPANPSPAPAGEGPTPAEAAPTPTPEVVPTPEVAPNPVLPVEPASPSGTATLLVFDGQVTLALTAPAAPADDKWIALTEKLDLKAMAGELSVRGGMRAPGKGPSGHDGWWVPVPTEFGAKSELAEAGWWFPAPDQPILVVPHRRTWKGKEMKAALLIRKSATGFEVATLGGKSFHYDSTNSDAVSTISFAVDRSSLTSVTEFHYDNESDGRSPDDSRELELCTVTLGKAGLEQDCREI